MYMVQSQLVANDEFFLTTCNENSVIIIWLDSDAGINHWWIFSHWWIFTFYWWFESVPFKQKSWKFFKWIVQLDAQYNSVIKSIALLAHTF